MKSGDSVLTSHGETGTLEKRWDHNDDSYDWWVRIDFTFEGRDYTTLEPWKERDLSGQKKKN